LQKNRRDGYLFREKTLPPRPSENPDFKGILA
jgi:hypothetical protein